MIKIVIIMKEFFIFIASSKHLYLKVLSASIAKFRISFVISPDFVWISNQS